MAYLLLPILVPPRSVKKPMKAHVQENRVTLDAKLCVIRIRGSDYQGTDTATVIEESQICSAVWQTWREECHDETRKPREKRESEEATHSISLSGQRHHSFSV